MIFQPAMTEQTKRREFFFVRNRSEEKSERRFSRQKYGSTEFIRDTPGISLKDVGRPIEVRN
jgi:hypothetical protein